MFKKVLSLTLSTAFILQSAPVRAADGEDDNGWIEDDSIQEILPGQVLRREQPPRVSDGESAATAEQQWNKLINDAPVNDAPISQAFSMDRPLSYPDQQQSESGRYKPSNQSPGKKNGFLHPPPVPWLNALGRGVKGVGTGSIRAAESTANLITNPQFIGAAAGLAAAGGLVYWGMKSSQGAMPTYTYPMNSNDDVYVRGHFRGNGTYVNPYMRSHADWTKQNNFSAIGNTNPYTGKAGWINPY